MMDELELVAQLRDEVPLGSADRAERAFLTSIQRPAMRRRTTTIAIAAAAAGGVAAAGLTLLPGHAALPGNTSGATPTAAQLLAKIADAAAAQPDPLVRDSQFLYPGTAFQGNQLKRSSGTRYRTCAQLARSSRTGS
jgi:hypothetical protein